jgi:hypothetical protein
VGTTVVLRAFVAGSLCLTLLPGCTRDDEGNGEGTASPTASAPATPDEGASPSPQALSAADIADRLGCTDRVPGQKAATDPVDPVEALDCKVGEVTYSIRIYNSNDDRDKVVAAAPTGAGYRNVGERWVVATTDQAAANTVLDKVGGSIVDLRYVTPGS